MFRIISKSSGGTRTNGGKSVALAKANINSPLTSSAGRLFDAVAAIL